MPAREAPRPTGPTTWKALAAGRSTNLGVKQDGSLWIWGWNGQGGGDGRLERSARITGNRLPIALPPTRIGSENDWASVSVGDSSLMAVKTNGTLWRLTHMRGGHSLDDDGDLADGPAPPSAATAVPSPQQLGTDADWLQVSTARSHTLSVRRDGSLWGWGLNMDGELGDGTREERKAPVRIGKERWRTVVTGALRTAGIRADGTLWVWGWRARGGDGGGDGDVVTSPLQLGSDTNWAQLSFSGGHLLAIKTDGSLWSYGSNDHGELGLGKVERSKGYALARVGSESDWITASAGDDFSVAIRRDGSLWTWGISYQGQLGDGSHADRLAPVRVAKDIVWRTVEAGAAHVTAEAADGTTWTWGENRQGQLGDGHPLVVLDPVQVQPGRTWRFVAGDEAETIALRDDGSMWTWGLSADGEAVKSTTEWKALAYYRGSNVIGIQPDGSLWDIWWHKDKPEKIERDPLRNNAGGARWTRLTATQHGVVVEDEQDGLWSLGRVQIAGPKGMTAREIWEPRLLGKRGEWGHAFAEIAPSAVLAQKKDGTFWLFEKAWMEKPPVQVDKNTHWERIIAGEFELLLLGQDGKLWRFDGASKERIGTSAWQTASVSSHHTLAIRKDGSLWSWGEGDAGELGTVYAGEQPSPVRIGTATDWAQVFAAPRHSLAIKCDGSLWVWGNNLNGELGISSCYRKIPSKLVIP
jgi:alpha-tubulin suppressor-like RCC1 family protein